MNQKDENRNTPMVPERKGLRHLAVPFVLIVGLSVALVAGLVVYTARSQDELAVDASIHLTRSVIAEMQRVLGHFILDYSYWDQAVDNLVTKVDAEWADENVANYMNDSHGVPAVYVLDAANRPVYSMVAGERDGSDPLQRFHGTLKALIDQTRAAPVNAPPQPAVGLARDPAGLHVVAASVFTDYDVVDGETIDRTTTSVLVVAKPLDSAFLDTLAQAYLLDELHLSPSRPLAPLVSLPLIGADGSSLGFLVWRPNKPGDELVVRVLPAIAASVFLAAILAFLFFRRAQAVVSAQARDIAIRQRVEAALLKSQLRLHEFTADAAHELRTPLAVMRASLDGVADQTLAESLRQDIDAMTRLVEQLLAEARLDSLDIAPTDETDLRQVCSEVAAQLAPLAVQQSKFIELEGTEVPVIVRGDAEALHHAMRNIVENAIRFTKIGTAVTITVGDDASVRVTDQGPVIPADMRDKVFRRFERLDRKAGGAGLGLSIVRRTVEAHDGVVEIADGPNGGAAFLLRFPLAPAEFSVSHATS